MGKNFDTERQERDEQTRDDRTFTIGGETFVARSTVRPEALVGYEQIGEDTPASEVLRIVDDVILAMIEDEPDQGHLRYINLRAREDNPIGLSDLIEVVKWLIEVQTGRPTEQPSPSGSLPEGNGTN